MTVSTTTSRADYTGNGVTTAFAVPFYFLDNSHLTVLRTQVSTGVITTLALTTDYTVSGAGNPAGGTITCLVAPTADQKISILRNVPFTQLNTYVPNDPFPAASHERALDQLTMEVQQLDEAQDRALSLPANTPAGTVSAELPTPQANKFIGWNGSATGLQNLDASTLASIVSFANAYSDVFSGNGVQTAFTLSNNPGSLANLRVSVSGVVQRPTIDYLWSAATTLTFTSAPAAGTNNILVQYATAAPGPLGIGTIAAQDASNVSITGGSITNITDLAIADGGTGASNATDARTNLGLGSIATQAASNVSISGGSATSLTTLSGAAIAGTTTVAAGHLANTLGTGSGGFYVGGGNGAQYTGVRLFADGASNWAAFQTTKAENPTELIVYPNASQGLATTVNGTNQITRVSGTNFSSSWAGKTLYFLRKKFTVSTVTPPNTLTVTEVGGGAVTFSGTETEVFQYFYTSGSGLCNVSGTTVTWVSGDPFVPLFFTDFEFTLNGVARTVSAFNSVTQYTLSAAPGNGTNIPFTWRGNINDQIATVRVQSLLGSDEENVNLKAFAGHNTFGRYYSITANYAGSGKYRPIFIGTGEFSDATFHHQIGCVPRNYAGATSDGYVSLGGVLGRDAMRVFGPSTSTAYANRFEVTGGATTFSPSLRARGSDTNVGCGYDTQGTGAHVFTSGSFGRINFKIYGSNASDYLITDASTGNPYLAVEGSSSDITLRLLAKGAGGVSLSTHLANGLTIFGAAASNAPAVACTGSDTNIPLELRAKGTGRLFFVSNAAEQFEITSTGSAVNKLSVTGAATGGAPVLSAVGSDANVTLRVSGKGTGNVDFFANGALQYRISGSTASVVNYAEFAGAATTGRPSLRGRGSDANVGIGYDTQGTGAHAFTSGSFGRTNFIIYGSAGNDYIAIDTATGAPVIATAGSSADRDIRLLPAGTGRVRFGTGTAATVAANFSAANRLEMKLDNGTTIYVPYSTTTW